MKILLQAYFSQMKINRIMKNETVKCKNTLLTKDLKSNLNVYNLSRIYPKAKKDNIYHFKNQ